MSVKTLINKVLSPEIWPLFGALGSASLLGGAFAFEHIGGYPPCPLCITQRWAHVWVIAIGIIGFAAITASGAVRRAARLVCWALGIALLISVYKAFNHAGIEYGWWAGPASCTAFGSVEISLDDLNSALNQRTNVVLCDEVAWEMFGISMAGWNGLVSLVLAGLSFTAAFRETRQ